MHKTIYIDLDEEITNVMDKIRREVEDEIFLVIPKGAMILQGVINLKLLKKEAEKIGKKIVIATNDMHARKVIDQIGIKTSDVDEAQAITPALNPEISREEEVSNRAVEEATEQLSNARAGEEVGSQSFFENVSSGGTTDLNKNLSSDDVNKIDIKSPKNDLLAVPGAPAPRGPEQTISNLETNTLRSGNVNANSDDTVAKEAPQESGSLNAPLQFDINAQKQSPVENQVKSNSFFGDVPKGINLREIEIGTGSPMEHESSANKKAEEYFLTAEENETGNKNERKKRRSKHSSGYRAKWKALLVFIIFFLGISVFVVWGYINYPKVSMDVYLENRDISKEIKIVVKEETFDSEENGIKGEYLEIIIEEEMEFNTTGETYESDDGKAKGRVKIINKYSEKDQPLVATTRVLSKEGKLFRLSKTISVPGMDGETPGEIEVSVIADKPGEDFNVDATTFTVEGFKGNDKYEKFEVVSEKSMEGGGKADNNKKLSMVSADDLKNARIKTVESLDDKLEDKIKEKIGENKKVFIDSVEKEIISDSEKFSHEEKEVTQKFTYLVQQRVKLMSFLEDDVKKVALSELEKEVGENSKIEGLSSIVYKKGIVDLDNKSLTMYIDVKMISWSTIDVPKLKDSIAGKKEDEMKAVLLDYPEIKRIELTFKPSWMTKMPHSKEKITINEKKEEMIE